MKKLLYILILILQPLISEAAGFQDQLWEIRGKVTDTGSAVLTGASVTIENSNLGVYTDSEGRYSLTGLKPGLYQLRFSFLGYETVVKEVVLKDNLTLDISLTPKAFLTDDVMVSSTRAGDHSPLAYTTIGNDLIRKQNSGYDMPYLLSLTPSLVETSEAGNGIGYTSLRIRGTDGNRINVTIDGIPLNDPESQQVFWVDLPDLASSVENIQVQRGAGTSTNGAGAFGATISIQTTNPKNEPFAEVNSSVGSFNTFKNVVSAGSGLLGGKFALQMRYSDIKSDGYISRTGSDHRSAYINGVVRTGRSMLKANLILGEEHTGIGWWGVPKEMLSIDRRYNPAGEYTDPDGVTRYYSNESDNYTQNHLQLIYSLKINDLLSFNTALHYTKGKGYYEEYREDQSFSKYALPSVTIGDSVIKSTDLIRRKWMSNDFYGAVYSLRYQKDRVEAVAGGGINVYHGDHFGRIIWMRNAGNTEKDYRWYINNSSKAEISLYGKINYSLTDKVSVFGDLQYRYIDYLMVGPDDDQKDITQSHRFSFFNPKGGLFYSISKNQDAYLSFSVANREPTRSDFKEASGDATATPESETLYDTEIGYKLRTEKSIIAVNVYAMIYKDQLVPTGELSDVGYSIMTNVSRSYRAGVELAAGVKPAEFIDWNINMTLSRNRILDFTEHYVEYSTTDWSEANKSNDLGQVDIAYSPSVTGSSDLSFRIAKNLNTHIISKYVGLQYIDNTMDPERAIDPYFVNNLRIDFNPDIKNLKGLELQLLINNILNNSYESNGYGGNWYEDGVEKSWSYYFPQAGINYMFRVGVRF
ncbi:MAG: TonB-dependent receptor [Bacteroidales bacterium]|nr:TonB-dependent receptor [Bacteroidales bacterium]